MGSVNHPKLYPAATASIKAAFYKIWIRYKRKTPCAPGSATPNLRSQSSDVRESRRWLVVRLERAQPAFECSGVPPRLTVLACVYSQNGAILTEALSSCVHTNGGSNETPCTRLNVYNFRP